MKPPLFIECSVCGREFGSKSIQIHEPQCLQKLRRTEIAQQETKETPPSTTKKIRRKKKTSERKLAMGTPASEMTRGPATTAIFSHSTNSAPSFVIMATTSTSNFASIERFNLPKIQSKTAGPGARPCTAVLDKPRILNPEYIQYDMSLTRIDFTGQSKSSTAIMDENQNNRVQRQNTQVIQNSTSRRHGFALPNVLDGNLTVVGHQNYQHQQQSKHQGKVFRSSDQSKLPPSANMMTTVDSILGDPQRKVRGDRTADMGLSLQSGKFWDDDAHHLPSTHTLMSLWSQEIYLMNALSSQLPALHNSNPNTHIPCLPPLFATTKLPNDFPCPCTDTPHPSSAPSIESLFASPNFPFFGKLSQCDLEKPLRTCFHLEKIPGHRNDFQPQQDHFVTPSPSSEFPQLQQPQPVDLSQSPLDQATTTADDAVVPDVNPAKQCVETTTGQPDCNESNEISKLPLPAELINQQKRHSQESLIKFDSICNQLGKTAKEREQEEIVTLNEPNDAHNRTAHSQNPSEGLRAPAVVHQGRDSLSHWIGEPFMQQHAYYAAPIVKDTETDTECESYYATPMGESQDEHEHEPVSNERSILAAIQELKQFIDGKRTVEIAQNQGTFALFPVLVPTVPAQNVSGAENETPSSLSQEPVVGTRMKLLSSEFTEISYSSPENSATPEYSQIETEVSDGVRTDNFEEGDGGVDSMREGSANSLKTIKSSSSCTKSSTPERSHARNRNHNSFFKHRTGSDADDESCDSQSTDIPLRLSSTRLKSKTALTKRHQRLKRRSSSTKRNGSFPKINLSSKEFSNNQNKAEAPSDTENTFPDTRTDDDPTSPFNRSETDLVRLKDFQGNGSVEDENDFENTLPDTIFETDSLEESVHCGTSEYNKKVSKDSEEEETNPLSPLPSLESRLDTHTESSPGGSNQTVIMRERKTPELIFSRKSASSQPSVERIFFRAAEVEPLVRRRPARTRPKTAGCVDSVAMWEGIQINNSDQTLRNEANFEEITFQTIARPPTRRRSSTRSSEGQRLRMNLTSSGSKAEKKQTTKAFNTKIQNLISNVNRVGELHREKLQTESKHLKETKPNQRPQTSPPMNPITQLPPWDKKPTRNPRPSTSVPPRPAENTLQKSNGFTSKSKNPRSKRSLSQSATPRAEPPSWNVTSRPMTATAVRNSTRSKPNSTTVRTPLVDKNKSLKPFGMYEKSKSEGKAPKKLPPNHSTDEEPLELLFSFKTKPPSKRTLSPLGLAPQHQNQMDQASLYKHIEIHRRQALSEAQKLLAKKRSLLRKIEKDLTDTSTSALSSPLSSPKRVASANNFNKSYNNTKPQQTKLLLKELSKQVHLEKLEMNNKLTKTKEKIKSKSANASNKTGGKCAVPLPMSKRVHFSSPIQTKLPRVKPLVKPANKSKEKSQQTSTQSSRSPTPTLDVDNNNYSVSFNSPNFSQGKVKVSVRKAPKNGIRKAVDINEDEDEDSDRNDIDGNGEASTNNAESQWSLGEGNQSRNGNEDDTYDSILERLEGQRDKIRGKEFERRKRGKGDQDPNKREPIYSSVSLYLPKRAKSEKMIDLKIIVRRKTKDGKFPSLDDAVGPLSSKCTYLIVDEEPLTKSGPNPYIEAQMKLAKPKSAARALKITTSDASTVDSLPSQEALNRFLTCYVCGQTLNVRDYFAHERKCVNSVNKNNVYLADEDKRFLPPKPQGTITISHWNNFAYESVKSKLIRCPYCEMEFFPDRPEEVNIHQETCTNKPLPPVAPPRGINLTDHCTVFLADEAQGWVIPTIKELHRNNWNQGYARVEQYTRPAANRLRKYKKAKSEIKIQKQKKKPTPRQ